MFRSFVFLVHLFPLKGNEDLLAASHGRKLGWPILARLSQAQFPSVLAKLVNPQIYVAFSLPFRGRQINRLGLFRRVDLAGSLADLLVIHQDRPAAVRTV